jgi:hypothetical protein
VGESEREQGKAREREKHCKPHHVNSFVIFIRNQETTPQLNKILDIPS